MVNSKKTWLVTKDSLLPSASEVFGDSVVNINTDGWPVLGSPIGKSEYIAELFVTKKVKQWVAED